MSATINSLIEYMEPEFQAVLRAMMERRGTTGELLIADIPRILTPENLEERIAIINIQNVSKVKFAAKLTFTKRCEILALHRMGYTNEILSKAYSVDRRTITHIHNGASPHYRKVREREIGMGRAAFSSFYLNAEVINRIESFKNQHMEGPNKLANRKQGLHHVKNNYCTYTHRVIIRWLEANEAYGEAGWFYQDLDGDSPDKWFIAGADKKNTLTSQACYLTMVDEIMDKIT